MKYFACLRVGKCGYRPYRITVNAYRAHDDYRFAGGRIVSEMRVPDSLTMKEFCAANESYYWAHPNNRKNFFFEEGGNPNTCGADFDLPSFITAYWDDEIGNGPAFSIPLILGNQTFGDGAWNFGVEFTAGLVTFPEHTVNSGNGQWQEVIEAMRKRIGNLDFDCASHCVYHLAVHVVFCTKFRRQTLTSEKRDFLKISMEQIALAYNSRISEWNGESDHVHMLLHYPPTVILSSLVGALKSKSASAILDRFGVVNYGRHSRTFWSSGFFLCSVGGATLAILKAYIENQGR